MTDGVHLTGCRDDATFFVIVRGRVGYRSRGCSGWAATVLRAAAADTDATTTR